MKTDKHKRRPAYLDVRAVLDHFGGLGPLVELAARRGYCRFGYDAVKKWRQRGRIPSDRLVEMRELGARLGKPLDINSFVRGGNGKPI
jgi:hypothetical protein